MRGNFIFLGINLVVLGAMALPDPARARENDQAETANCTDPKHRHVQVRPLTESIPIRKSEKLRIRRILM